MEQSPSENKSHSAIQEIPQIVWNLEVHCCVHKIYSESDALIFAVKGKGKAIPLTGCEGP
jgi:hypothetical protein